MKTKLVLKKVGLGLSLALVSANWLQAGAQGIVTFNPSFFHADTSKNIILINAPLSQLNPAATASDSIRTIAVGGQQYALSRAVAHFSTATSYQATANAKAYTVYFTRVPVLAISTRHQIVDAPSVAANLVLADTTGIIAQSAMGIEFRGASSQSYPKKSYELSLWADTLGTADRDLSLLGMRSDNKWNLQAMYNDQLRVRLKVANELWQDINHVYYKAQEPNAKSGIKLTYTEIFINGSYQGIYTLTERVDKKQLKLKKYANNTIAGELYKGIGEGTPLFNTVPPFDNASTTWSWDGFEYKEPSEQIDWTNLHSFSDFVVNSSDANFYAQYKSWFNLANAVDYFIFLNVMRATDNTGKNIYIAKYKANEPYFYVPWDLDGVLGNDWAGINTYNTNDILSNGFYDRLRRDYSAAGFQAAVASRWGSLRTSVITSAYISAKIKTNNDYLLTNNVYEREQLAWPAYHYDTAQLMYPATWLTSRLAYLDNAYRPTATALGTASAHAEATLQLYPNPASDYLNVELKAGPAQLTIQDVSGHTVLQASLAAGASRLALSKLPKGLYVATIKTDAATTVQKLLLQ
jgi:spore coat protein H